MFNNSQYAEVSWILGASEHDRQISILSRALTQHIPGLENDNIFGNAAAHWEQRNNTWPLELEKRLANRNPPLYTQTGITSLNNSFSVHVSLTNKHREASAKHLNKLLDETRARVKDMDGKINSTLHNSRIEFDRERANADHLMYLEAQHRYPDNIYDRL